MSTSSWKFSWHGGHSGEFCEHARGRLREVLEQAWARGFSAYGISEHAPRLHPRFLYPSEREKGYDVSRLEADFESYSRKSRRLAEEWRGRLQLWRGFEAEVVPAREYVGCMRDLWQRHGFDYLVGSVHHVYEISVDGPLEDFEKALGRAGSLEKLAVAYYRQVAEMVEQLHPTVVAHLDLIRKNGRHYGSLHTPRVRRAAQAALEAVRSTGALLEVNTAAYRKGLPHPYPEPWLLIQARDLNIPFCLSDDSHGPEEVGAGFERARRYLLQHGIREVAVPQGGTGGLSYGLVTLPEGEA